MAFRQKSNIFPFGSQDSRVAKVTPVNQVVMVVLVCQDSKVTVVSMDTLVRAHYF